MNRRGTLHVLGMGPGDPELMTLKAARIVASAPVVAYFAKRGAPSRARAIAAERLRADAEQLAFEYPFTTELSGTDLRYKSGMAGFYDTAAEEIARRLDTGRDVALLCEGDPLLYGSAIHIFERLSADHTCDVVPGVTAMSACWSAAQLPVVRGDTVLSVLPGTLGTSMMLERLAGGDAAVILKVGRNLGKIRALLGDLGRAGPAVYVEFASTVGQRVLPLAEAPDPAPYFSLVLVPARQ